MQNGQQNKRINGAALEMIMHDVLRGMQDFTLEACNGCGSENLEILAVEEADHSAVRSAAVLPLRRRCKSGRAD